MQAIVNRTELREILQQWKQRGSKIVFTNGCFDIIHRGHVELLEKARALGDCLVLGLNSDDSVRRLKGEGRPLVNQEDRAFILSRLEAVDAVSIFDEDTPMELLKVVQPHVLVKGGDYRINTIVGHELVQSYGGKVQTIPLSEGRSTTNIVQKIKLMHGSK